MLVRHGETEYNRSGIVQGRIDVPLNAIGRRQAVALGVDLAHSPVTAVYSSPLTRARETAAAIAAPLGLPVVEVQGLTEMDVGEMDGLTFPEIRSRFGQFLETWRADETTTLPLPGGEDLMSLQRRSWSAVLDMRTRHPDGLVVVVSHQFTIQAILCSAVAVPLRNFERFSLAPASKTLVEIDDGGGRIHYLNDCCHHPDGH